MLTCTSNIASNYGGFRVLAGAGATLAVASEYRHPNNPDPAMPAFRYDWPQTSTICDIDRDGYGDVVVVDPAVRVFYGGAAGLAATSPLDISTMMPLIPMTGRYGSLRCVRDFMGGPSIILGNGTAAMGGRLEVLSADNRKLTVSRILPSPDPGDPSFGAVIVPSTADINGDGHDDIVVYSQTKRWVIYGR